MPRKSLARERPSIRSYPNNLHGIETLVSSGSKGRRLGRQVGIGIAGHFNLTFDRQKAVTDNTVLLNGNRRGRTRCFKF